MKVYIRDIERQETREHETSLNLLQFVKVNFCAWGFYEVKKTGAKEYSIFNKFTNDLEYLVFKK